MLLPCSCPALAPLLLCSWPNPGVLPLLPLFRSCPTAPTWLQLLPCSFRPAAVSAPRLLLPFSLLAPVLLLLLPCSCSYHAPAPAKHLSLSSSCSCLAPPVPLLPCSSSYPTPALLLPCSFPCSCSTPAYLPTCSYPAPALFLLLPCSCSALLLPFVAVLLLQPCSCSRPPQTGSLHHHQHLVTFFGTARAVFYGKTLFFQF